MPTTQHRKQLSTFTWLTEVVVVGLLALPLALATQFLFPRLLDDLFGVLPYKLNERAATLIIVGYVWGFLLLAFRRSSDEGTTIGRVFGEALLAALFSALVTGAGFYVVNTLFAFFPIHRI